MSHVALVTGSNHGIGAAVALALAELGNDVVLTYLARGSPDSTDFYERSRAASAAWVVERITAIGGRAIQLDIDLTSPGAPDSIFEVAEAELGAVDILVNNASAWVADTFKQIDADRFDRPLARLGEETFDTVFSVDARASALLIAEFARRHRDHDLSWGRIVSLTSGGHLGFPEEVSYGAAKAALENLTMSAAFELVDQGITANVVHPPVTDTGWIDDDVRKFVETSSELFHVATPEQVAEVVAFLCSDAGALVTGNRIVLR